MQWKFCSQMQQYLLLPAILLSLSSCTPVQEDPALPENSMQTDVPAEGSGNEDPETETRTKVVTRIRMKKVMKVRTKIKTKII